MVSVFAERYAQACRRHPDLVAVHESPNGDIALVLRHTFVPLPEEHAEWRRATRAAARDALDDLRGAGFEGSVVVAQWLPVPRLARIFDSWPRRWEGDSAPRGPHARNTTRPTGRLQRGRAGAGDLTPGPLAALAIGHAAALGDPTRRCPSASSCSKYWA